MSLKRVFRNFHPNKLPLIVLVALALILVSRPGATQIIIPNPVVNGGGSALLTLLDPASVPVEFPAFASLARPTRYSIDFLMIAGVDNQDNVNGYINFFFGEAFSQAWGPIPPNNRAMFSGIVDKITQENGYTLLEGTLREADYTRGQGVVFLIDDTFKIKVGGDLGPNEFILEWCALPPFLVKVTAGDLTVNSL